MGAGFDPGLWGRTAWAILYESACFSSRSVTHELLHEYGRVLPCEPCRKFTQSFVESHLMPGDPFQAVYNLHQAVSTKTETCIPSMESMRRRYVVIGSDVSDRHIMFFVAMVHLQGHSIHRLLLLLRTSLCNVAYRSTLANAIHHLPTPVSVPLLMQHALNMSKSQVTALFRVLQKEAKGSATYWKDKVCPTHTSLPSIGLLA